MAQLRIILDQLVAPADPDLADASRGLAAGLVRTAPPRCDVEAIVPAGDLSLPEGITAVRRMALARRELSAAWQLGVAPGVGGGMIHSPTLLAPLVRHDRVHDHDQTVPTVWDLRAWEEPESLPKAVVVAQRTFLRRAVKHADAVVVPTHEIAERLAAHAKLRDRIRVIAGAAPEGFARPLDAVARRSALSLPAQYVVLSGSAEDLGTGFRAAAAADLDAVVLDIDEGAEPALAELAAIAGLGESRAHIRGVLDRDDRAAVVGGARALVATSARTAWPWRAMEALALSVPVVAVDAGVHRDVIAEGGALVAAADIPDAVVDAVGDGSRRLTVLAGDRARAFSWASAAERVWGLHADL